ncbi:MAG: YitT family protein [Anaerolineae bacterium]|jgi:uncharacterized membrane-anchored protein YitT (DUF2179 family)|nr:YitT family protein [Anaerolineae bacterium]
MQASILTLSWRAFLGQWIQWTLGAIIGALGVVIFLAPFDIAPAGVSGVAVILNIKIGTPIGLMVMLGNIPIQYWAYRRFGWRSVFATVYILVLFSLTIDLLPQFFVFEPVSSDVLLNALFGGIVGGLGSGLAYRAGATFGGTSTLARIFQDMLGLPLSSTYLYANLATVALAGVILGWEGALYAIVVIAAEGAISDYILEGPSVIRTCVIITEHPRQVADGILYGLGRGVSSWQVTGMFTGQNRTLLYVTVARFQVDEVRRIVIARDPNAFIVIGQGHVAYGEGFRRNLPPTEE